MAGTAATKKRFIVTRAGTRARVRRVAVIHQRGKIQNIQGAFIRVAVIITRGADRDIRESVAVQVTQSGERGAEAVPGS